MVNGFMMHENDIGQLWREFAAKESPGEVYNRTRFVRSDLLFSIDHIFAPGLIHFIVV